MMQLRTRLLFLGAVCAVAWLIFRSIDGQTEKVVICDCSETVVLNEFADDRMREALLRHLSASAGWTVGTAGVKGVLEATMETHGPTGDDVWSVPQSPMGVQLFFDTSPSTFRELLAFDRKIPQAAGTNCVEVSLTRQSETSDHPILDSTVLLAGGRLVLAVHESNVFRERDRTVTAIRQVCIELSAVKDNVEEIERIGYLRNFLPDGSTKESAVEIPLELREMSRGVYLISGYLNPMESGYITIRSFHTRSGEELEADLSKWRTVQYIGWSSRPDEKFHFQHDYFAPSYLTPEESQMDYFEPQRLKAMAAEQEIRIEVWFHGTDKRKLCETTRTLVPWMR